MKDTTNYSRRFSLEKDFMDYDTDDLLYGAMQYLATFHPELGKLYLTAKKYTKNKKDLMAITDTNSRQIKAHLDKLIQRGLIKEEYLIVTGGGEKVLCYTFPYKYEKQYMIIDNEMLWYIVSTRNKQAVRVYLRLLSWYKSMENSKEDFIFTNKHIITSLGYSETSTIMNSYITNILESFAREGVIKYETVEQEFYTNEGKEMRTYRKKLIFVAKSIEQLKKV